MRIEEHIDAWGRDFINKMNNLDLSAVFPAIRQVVRNSIISNFRTGGRFGSGLFGGGGSKWKQSGRAGRQSGQTLRDRGILMNSIEVFVEMRNGQLLITAGSNQPYAAAHQFGVNKTVNVRQHTRMRKTKSGTIQAVGKRGQKLKKIIAQGISIATVASHSRKMNLPARPFLVLQDDDVNRILQLLHAEIIKQMAKS